MLYQSSENPVLIWTSPAALPTFPLVKEMRKWKKNAVSDLRTISLFFFFFRAVIVLPPLFSSSQPRVEHEESSIVSLLKQAAAMAAREG